MWEITATLSSAALLGRTQTVRESVCRRRLESILRPQASHSSTCTTDRPVAPAQVRGHRMKQPCRCVFLCSSVVCSVFQYFALSFSYIFARIQSFDRRTNKYVFDVLHMLNSCRNATRLLLLSCFFTDGAVVVVDL